MHLLRCNRRPFQKLLSAFILILLIAPFQPLRAALAAEGIRLLTPPMDETPVHQALWGQLRQPGSVAGPEVLNEGEFVSAMRLHRLSYVVVPLTKDIEPVTVDALTHYVEGGGKLVLLPMAPLAELVDHPLLSLIDVHPAGLQTYNEDLNLQWKGTEDSQNAPLKAMVQKVILPKSSTIFSIALSNSKQADLLASWDSQASAVVQTPKGILFNGQWGTLARKALPEDAQTATAPIAWGDLGNESWMTVAQSVFAVQPFQTVTPPDAVAQQPQPAAVQTSKPVQTQPQAPAVPAVAEKPAEVPSEKLPEKPAEPVADAASAPNNPSPAPAPVMVVKQPDALPPAAQPTSTASAAPSAEPTQADAKSKETNVVVKSATEEKVALPPVVEPNKTLAKTPEDLKEEKPTPVAAVQPTQSTIPAPEQSAKPSLKTANSDDEVLNNILGVPENTPASPSMPTQPAGERQQKHFSFLDAEASSVLAPDFDYGVYSMGMRALDSYKRHIQDAIDTSRQLAFQIPEEQVKALLAESDVHKKQFESLYLNGQIQPGLDAYAQARKLALQALALTTQSPKVEGRAIWLDRGTIVQAGGPNGLKTIMQKLHRAGINVVYFEALNAGFPLYQSAVLKPSPLLQGDWDPLQVAVEEGHRLGMEVHAWVWCFAVGNRRHNDLINKPSSYPGPILEDAGMLSEALRGRDGSLNMDLRQSEYWLSPASPKAREFLLAAYKEIMTRYPVDGLHLDYIRYPFQTGGTRMGFEPVGKERFAQATGMSLDSLDDYTLRMWIAWKTYQVSSFVQQVSEMVRQVRPQAKISAAVFPMRRDARIVAIQQDWETWVDNGWVDMLNPMSYTTDPGKLQSIYEYVSNSPQRKTLFYPGIALKHLDGGTLVSHLEALREKGGMGSTLFAGAYLDNEKVDTLGQGPFKDTNSLPPHRDAVRALQTLVTEYDAKLGQLQANGGITAADAEGLRATAGQLSTGLTAVKLDPTQGASIQQTLQKLQALNNAWTSRDKAAHPYRAAYFSNLVFQMNELMGYWADKSVQPKTASEFAKSGLGKTPVLPSVSSVEGAAQAETGLEDAEQTQPAPTQPVPASQSEKPAASEKTSEKPSVAPASVTQAN